jgi:hypothetical protein
MASRREDHEESVRDLLRRRGAPESVVSGGLAGLVESWERTVGEIEAGYRLGIDDYLNDMDGRQLLEDAWGAANDAMRKKFQPRLRAADERARAALAAVDRCLWGADVARYHGWTAAKQWWYFMRPRSAGEDLERELKEMGF